jgi:hypothetical protein
VGVLLRLEDHLERIAVLLALGLEAQHHVAEHRHEAAVAVPGEARVRRAGREPLHRGVVQPEVEDRVHHAGHRRARAGADRDEQRVGGIAEALAGERLHLAERRLQLGLERLRQLLAGLVVLGADVGGDREAGWNRDADVRHLRQPGALPAEQILHVLVAVGPAAAEGIDALRRHASPRDGRISTAPGKRSRGATMLDRNGARDNPVNRGTPSPAARR